MWCCVFLADNYNIAEVACSRFLQCIHVKSSKRSVDMFLGHFKFSQILHTNIFVWFGFDFPHELNFHIMFPASVSYFAHHQQFAKLEIFWHFIQISSAGTPPCSPKNFHSCRLGSSGGSSVRRPGSEDPHRREPKLSYFKKG